MRLKLSMFVAVFLVFILGCESESNTTGSGGTTSRRSASSGKGGNGVDSTGSGGTDATFVRQDPETTDATVVCSVVLRPCNCGETEGTALTDSCTGETKEDCVCPIAQECVDSIGCIGEQECDGRGECESCTCVNHLATGTSTRPKKIAKGLDDSLFILLGESPWIEKVDAHGNVTSLDVHGSLSWVRDFVVDGNGDIVLAGYQTDLGDAEIVEIQRLDSSGALVGSAQWELPLPEFETNPNCSLCGTRLGGLGVFSDGRVLISAVQYNLVGLAVVSDETTIVDEAITSFDTILNQDVFAGGMLGFRAECLKPVVGPNDEIALGGSVTGGDLLNATWFAWFDSSGQFVGSQTSEPGVEWQNLTLAIGADGVIYNGYNGFSVLSLSRDVYIHRVGDGLIGLDATLGVWVVAFAHESIPTWIYKLHAIDNSVIAILNRGIGRVSQNGAFIDFTTNEVSDTELLVKIEDAYQDSLVRNGDELVILGATDTGYRITSMKFATTPITPAQTGDPCYADFECESGGCCLEGWSTQGVCADPKVCGVGYRCRADSDCTSNFCLIAAGQTRGVCTSRCDATSDCDSDFFCAQTRCSAASCAYACLIDCFVDGEDACKAADTVWSCEESENIEGATVSVCR